MVVVNVSLEELPAVFKEAVGAVPSATIIEVRPNGAIVGRRTTFAAMSETTRFAFKRRDVGTSEVEVLGTTGGVLGLASFRGEIESPGMVLDTGRAVLRSLDEILVRRDGAS